MTPAGLSRFLSPGFCAKQTKIILATVAVFVAMFGASQAAHAQCYTFAIGVQPSLTLNITNLPVPTITSDGVGGTNYNYDLTSVTGNSATLVVAGTQYMTTTFGLGSSIRVDANPHFTIVQIFVQWFSEGVFPRK